MDDYETGSFCTRLFTSNGAIIKKRFIKKMVLQYIKIGESVSISGFVRIKEKKQNGCYAVYNDVKIFPSYGKREGSITEFYFCSQVLNVCSNKTTLYIYRRLK